MEIEKLKDMLRNAAGGPVGIQMCQEAADALEQLQAENEKIRKERAAAIRDISRILANIEEIRLGHSIDNDNLDKDLADLCGFYCAINGSGCYKEDEPYYCKNFKWRGPKED